MAFTLSSDAATSSHFNGTPSTSTTVTLATVNQGDYIKVWVTIGANPATTSITVSDPTNGTYNKKLSLFDAGDSQGSQHFYIQNAASGTNLVITASYASTAFVGIYAAAWSGADTVTGFDKEAAQTQTAPGTTADLITSGTNTTTQADLILGSCMDTSTGSNTKQVHGTGFSNNTNGNQTAVLCALFENLIQGAAGSRAATYTDSTNGGTAKYATHMMAVLPLAAAAATPGSYVPVCIATKYVGPAVLRTLFHRTTPVYATPPVVAVQVVFRKTLSLFGSGTGKRQSQK